MKLTPDLIQMAVKEINLAEEKGRRALAKRRHDIYKDGGRAFLIEQIRREFDEKALKEMRLAPINLLKKIVNKRASIYKRAPVRKCEKPSDQKLVDYYVKDLKLDQTMGKLNRALILDANPIIYTRPIIDKKDPGLQRLRVDINGSHQYSVITDKADRSQVNSYVFSAFDAQGTLSTTQNVPSATGAGSFMTQTSVRNQTDVVDSSEYGQTKDIQYIFWSKEDHTTVDYQGAQVKQGIDDDGSNPISRMPIVRVTRDLDNEPWSRQGEDLIDLTIAIQMGWSDLLTIAKHQGFSLLAITSEEEPKQLTMGINKALWLKSSPGPNGSTTTMDYVQAQSPLDQYRELLMELLGLLLTTNDMDPASIGGKAAARNFTSGFHALIAMSDNLEAIEADKPILADAEGEHWEVIKEWHNLLVESGVAVPEAKALGKFSDDLQVAVNFSDVKPLQSEEEIIGRVERKWALGAITKRDMIKELNPDWDDKQIDAKLIELEQQAQDNMKKAQENAAGMAEASGKPIAGTSGKTEPVSDFVGK